MYSNIQNHSSVRNDSPLITSVFFRVRMSLLFLSQMPAQKKTYILGMSQIVGSGNVYSRMLSSVSTAIWAGGENILYMLHVIR